MKKRIAIVLAALMACVSLAACSSGKSANYADGTYEGTSTTYENTEDGVDAGSGYGTVSITIKDNKITDCTFTTYELDGTLKDEDYGKEQGEIANRDFFNKAQKAVAACDEYASELVQNGQLDGIDSISGATYNYNEFKEAVEDALAKAEVSE